MDVIIDGYNLIGSDQGLQGALEHKRNWLVQQLARYQKLKQFNVIVVFDGWRAGSAHEASEKIAGLSVIYSRLGEKADQVIVRIAREKGSGAVVVSSDREIRSAVERFGAVAIHAGEFKPILRSIDGVGFEDDSGDEDELASDRRGNPNRLRKSERKRIDKLKKLKL
jgi:predicted RNA-binding protein with PIN domain